MFSRTSSHRWGKWNLPMFLLRGGSLTLMSMASFMALVVLCTYLPIMEKLFTLTHDVGMVIDGRRGPKVFPKSFPKGSFRSPYVLLVTIQFVTLHLYLHITLLFCQMLSLSLGVTRRFLMLLPPLKWTLTSTLPQMSLKLSLNPSV